MTSPVVPAADILIIGLINAHKIFEQENNSYFKWLNNFIIFHVNHHMPDTSSLLITGTVGVKLIVQLANLN